MEVARTDAPRFDVVVVGAGHAGCEAALAAARRGASVLVITPNLERIGYMPCNPSIGGPAKGHLVAEVDALGGEMGRAADRTALQMRRLNTGKGPAVQALRAQCDKTLYALTMKEALENQPGVSLLQDEAIGLIVGTDAGAPTVAGVEARTAGKIQARAVVVTAGTFLRGRLIRGEESQAGGRAGEKADVAFASALSSLGIQTRRLKTGTPPRIDARTVDFRAGELQAGDPEPQWFSHEGRMGRVEPLVLPPLPILQANLPSDVGSGAPYRPQLSCLRIDTNPKTHAIITANIHRAPMFNGAINGVGPRYCPSIEDKVFRFAGKDAHPVYLEPEGWRTSELYVQGMSTSLPADCQEDVLHTIPALRHARITRYGYAVEYDAVDPNELTRTLEARQLPGLFLAGQVNGTSGYEEAAAQGIVAGANAAAHACSLEPLVLRRDQAYIGVLIDDLISRPLDEPYRMLTSRAEHRLLLRTDTAGTRLTSLAHELGLVSDQQAAEVRAEDDQLAAQIQLLQETWFSQNDASTRILEQTGIAPTARGQSAYDLLRRPEVTLEQIRCAVELQRDIAWPQLNTYHANRLEMTVKYAGFIERAEREARRIGDLDRRAIPTGLAYGDVPGLRIEAQTKLAKAKPETLGQASRLSGVTPSDISALLIYAARLEAKR